MTHVALLRGINVGGKNMLPMKDLAKMFGAAGCTDVRTYIQSGNVIFKAPAGAPGIADGIVAKIEKQFGFRIPIILRTSQQLLQTIRNSPFLESVSDQRWLHVYFLAHAP